MNSLLSLKRASLTVPKFATGANAVPVAGRLALRHDTAETRAEPEGDKTLALAMIRGMGTGNFPSRDIIPIGNKRQFNMITAPMEKRLSRTLPKRQCRKFCELCPDLSPFASNKALKKHRKQVHTSAAPQARNASGASLLGRGKCTMCRATVSQRHLARHLEKVHGIPDAVAKTGPLTVSAPHTDGAAELSSERRYSANDTALCNINEATSGRVYCQEHDCGRGFSSAAHLESHVRFFHSKWMPKQTVGEREAPSSSKGVAERSEGLRPPELYYPSTTTIALSQVEERANKHDLRPPSGASLSDFRGECQGTNSMEEDAAKPPEIANVSSPSIQDAADTQPKAAQPVTGILPLHCRMCDSPPTVTTQPTVTTCGHLFCLECIAQHVSSTSRCPVCNNSLLLYCLFKLDLSGMT